MSVCGADLTYAPLTLERTLERAILLELSDTIPMLLFLRCVLCPIWPVECYFGTKLNALLKCRCQHKGGTKPVTNTGDTFLGQTLYDTGLRLVSVKSCTAYWPMAVYTQPGARGEFFSPTEEPGTVPRTLAQNTVLN